MKVSSGLNRFVMNINLCDDREIPILLYPSKELHKTSVKPNIVIEVFNKQPRVFLQNILVST